MALDLTIESGNSAAEELYGYDAKEMVGAPMDMLQLDEIAGVTTDWDAVGPGGSVSLDSSVRRNDGRVVDVAVTLSPLRDDSGEVTGVVSVARDVSAARRDAARLAEAESRFAGAFEAASTGMALTSPDGRFLAVNPALCAFLGRDAETLLASSVQAVTHPDDVGADIEQGRRALAGEIDSFQQPKRYILPTGGIVWGLLTISISRDADGAPQHYVSQVEDITDRKTSEGELRRYAAQLQALSEQDPFLGELAAELIDDEAELPEARRAQAGATGVRTLQVALQARDFYTSAHSKQVVELASAVAARLGLDPAATRDVEQVALLHDIGKVGIPDAILQKQGPLDDDEWTLMRQHPVVGEHIIAGTPGLSHLAPAVRAEHERWDGGGYPDGLAGEHIPLASRITLACDALNAMTSDRPYRPAMTLEAAHQELRAGAGTQFDPDIIHVLLSESPSRPRPVATAPAGT